MEVNTDWNRDSAEWGNAATQFGRSRSLSFIMVQKEMNKSGCKFHSLSWNTSSQERALMTNAEGELLVAV